ncbi:DUF4349 domain-containing protein [Microbacterium cremeum]|uniref:DUF4349 domain-containing protein n=1 Tax=Microbacterium cremeum TaxID=2782169 RepID=UPI001E5930AF|nr:DUF4349 domain-containing protein [Microbacterium cremeum]
MSMQHLEPATPVTLPELSRDRVDEIEEALFSEIARDRSRQAARRTRRGRLWIAGGAAAAIVAVAAVIAPSVGSLVSGTGGTSDGSAIAPVAPADDAWGGMDSGVALDSREAMPGLAEQEAADQSMGAGSAADRDIITTASATVSVDDVEAAARTVGESAVAHGGYVESMSIGTDGRVYPVDPMDGGVVDSTMPVPYTPDGAWVTVRVPADELPALVDELADTGEVTATSINRYDVTEQTVDLEARIDAAQASVDRLTELMAQAESVADLIAAESALSERQALLESYQQQLEMLETQVAMSTLTVTIVPAIKTVDADPAGFADGVVAGWNGLVATLNGIVIALGFLLPWLVVVGVAALIVWGIVRVLRRRRVRREDAAMGAGARHAQAETTGDAPAAPEEDTGTTDEKR